MSFQDIQGMPAAHVNELLVFYGIPGTADDATNRRRILAHLGCPLPLLGGPVSVGLA